MRALVLSMLVVSAPALAHADAIRGFDGECPPGLERGIRNHREACIPRACERSAQCGSGAACRPIDECWAERDVPRPRRGGTERRRIVVGACDAQRHCADADATCERRKQCEPTAPTPAWDRTERRWTGVGHPASTRAPAPGAAVGCSATQRGGALPLAIVIGAIWIRMRRRDH